MSTSSREPAAAVVGRGSAGAHHRHLVQLYVRPGAMRDTVAAWLAPPLAQGGGAMLVATSEHAGLVLDALRSGGLDPADLQRAGRLVVLDADAAMARFMVEGTPDPARFGALLADVLTRLQGACVGPSREVRAWGEMVNLLWQRGKLPAAQRLEELWNEVIDRHGIRLLCSYRIAEPRPEGYLQVLRDLSRGHAELLPSEDQAAFDRDVFEALAAGFGREEARALWSLLLARRSLAVAMPPADTVLAAVDDMVPGLGGRLLAAAARRRSA